MGDYIIGRNGENIEINRIYCEDNVKGMKRLGDNTIDMVCTSPPYDNLRTYNGYSFDFENVAKELYRVTKQGGVVVWVVGDATIKGSETGTSFRQALYFKEIGFNLHDTMIYRKTNPMPMSGVRYAQCFEYMFILGKGKPKTFNPIKEPCRYAGKQNFGKRTIYTKDDSNKELTRKTIKDEKIKDNIFSYYVGSLKDSAKINHPAMFPKELAHDHIISWSNEGDIVLDCFMGSGTTAVAALQLGRKYIGFEISQEYVDIANKRIAAETSQLSLFK